MEGHPIKEKPATQHSRRGHHSCAQAPQPAAPARIPPRARGLDAPARVAHRAHRDSIRDPHMVLTANALRCQHRRAPRPAESGESRPPAMTSPKGAVPLISSSSPVKRRPLSGASTQARAACRRVDHESGAGVTHRPLASPRNATNRQRRKPYARASPPKGLQIAARSNSNGDASRKTC